MIAEAEFHALKRPSLLKVAKWIATFKGLTGPQLMERISNDVGQELSKELTRKAIPSSFRMGLFRQYQSLSVAERSVLVEKFFPHLTSQISPIELNRSWQSMLTNLIPGIDPHQFDQDSFSALPAWPKSEFLLFRKIDDDHIRLSQMTIRKNEGCEQLPHFLTLRKNDIGESKVVQGVVLKSGSDIYTIGQLEGTPGLRFTRMKLSVQGSLHGPRRASLFGLRLGLKGGSQPFAHVLFGRQMRDEVSDLRKELSTCKGGIFSLSDTLIQQSLTELDIDGDALMARLSPTVDQTGIQPVLPDSEYSPARHYLSAPGRSTVSKEHA